MNKKHKTLVINLFAGPGTGKSTCMAGVFSELKLRGINCEMAPEYVKEKVWEGSLSILEDQIYVFGKQLHSIRKLLGKVDVIITDSPVLLSIVYAKHESKAFETLVVETFKNHDALNYLLIRQKMYNPAGRMQTEQEAVEKDAEIKSILDTFNVTYTTKASCKTTVVEIADEIEKHLNMLD